ncbi:MAG TPA: YceD family protein [Polyangiaceae bacterium]
MSQPAFVVPLADLERGPRRLSFNIPESWLRKVLVDTEASSRGLDGRLDVELNKNGRHVMVRGRARVSLSMRCVRTLDPVNVDLEPEIFLLLSRVEAPSARPKGARKQPGRGGSKRGASHKPRGRSADRGGWEIAPELYEADAAQDIFEGEEIALDRFVREFILLDLPMAPLRPDLSEEPDPSIGTRGLADVGAPALETSERVIDPRLLPLVDIASRLQRNKE